MDNSLPLHIGVMLSGVFIASIAQALLKASAIRKYDSKIREYLNARVIIAYGMMVFATLCSLYAFRVIPISMGTILDSTGYIFVTIIGYMVFKERVNAKKIAALSLIIIGIAVYSLLG